MGSDEFLLRILSLNCKIKLHQCIKYLEVTYFITPSLLVEYRI